jgi:HEAT repeat protein
MKKESLVKSALWLECEALSSAPARLSPKGVRLPSIHVAGSVLLVLLVTQSASAQRISSADGRIVTASSAAQAQEEEPELNATTPSVDAAWNMLTTASQKATQTRIIALAALGTMDSDERAAKLIRAGMNDKELEVRTAAIVAAGQTKNRALIPALRERLHDPEPGAVFTAAVTLWKMNDRAGETFLRSVADGDSKAKPGLMHGAKNDVNKELHNPGALANLGATEGASILLGPFGFGVKAFEYTLKSGSDPARAAAIDLLAQSHAPGIDAELVDALSDKDVAVRAAAAKALGQRHDAGAIKPIGALLNDPKLPVRLFAAAAYINCSRGSTAHRTKLETD